MNQVSREAVLVELIQINIAEFVVANSVGKHVIDGKQDLMGHCYRRPLVPAPRFETVKFIPQVSALGFRCRVGRLHQRGLQIHIALGNAATLALAGGFGEDSDLRRWGLKLAERGGKNAKKRAVVAVARKLAGLLHPVWVSGEGYEPLRNTQKARGALGYR